VTPALPQRAAEVLHRIRRAGRTLVTAESCTAGALAGLLADAPGASEVFHGGFVTYTKQCKSSVLGVPEMLIRVHTAVSREVAEAMATGAVRCSPADMAVSITGVAGPEPDEDGNPVGLLHLAVAGRNDRVLHAVRTLGELPRDDIRDCALDAALALVAAFLEGSREDSTQRPSG
jgi:nicotinamide-nucleotide amidase